MSIPKQPRQLMINIMYLVLTALLALNVSAEIFNAFKLVNKSLEESNAALDKSNESLVPSIDKRALAKPEFTRFKERAPLAVQYGKEFTDYINSIVDDLIDKSGNKNGTVDDMDYIVVGDHKELKGKKNKDVTTREMVNNKKGLELKNKIIEYREKFLSLVDDSLRAGMESEVALNIDDETWKHSKTKRSWEEFTFKQMPLGACLPIFTKFINDAKSSENAILNHFSKKLGGEDVVLDKFTVISSPKKNYVIKGEPFETSISLAASTSKATNTKVSLSVNGSSLNVNDEGEAVWKTLANDVGTKKYNAVATVTNPVTGKTDTYKREFEFEVGERSCNVSAEKMNVVYIGVENPVGITAAGVSSAQLSVQASGGGIDLVKQGGGKYVANVKSPGEATIVLSGGGLPPTNFKFRVKRIPTPVPMLSDKRGGAMPNGVFKAQQGVIPVLEGFEFDAKCTIQGFNLVRVAPRQDAQIVANTGGRFSPQANTLIQQAKPGDRYLFEQIKGRCPGDAAARDLGDMSFQIK
ncbi:MAG: gliding motility protein GldM [Saprospiraceae bacterium]|nr:gliding motility protein GldM [Saprospiraceae bacterium]